MCCINIQHDCEQANCAGTIERPVLQERQAAALHHSLIEHTDSRSYLLNIFSIHNYTCIASIVPTSLELNNVKCVLVEKYGEIHAKAAKHIHEKRRDNVTQSTPPTIENSGGHDTPTRHRDMPEQPDISIMNEPVFEKKQTRRAVVQAEGSRSRKHMDTSSQQRPESSLEAEN